METPGTLSLEQQFKLEVLQKEVKRLTQEQAQVYLIELMRQNMVKDNILKHWIKKS